MPSAAARLPGPCPPRPPRLWFCPQEKTSLRTVLCPLFTQDLFFKYTWNNFLHFQVELCIGAILSHASREDGAEAGAPGRVAEPPPGNGHAETPQSATSHPENTMVMHVSPARAQRVACHCTPSPQTAWGCPGLRTFFAEPHGTQLCCLPFAREEITEGRRAAGWWTRAGRVSRLGLACRSCSPHAPSRHGLCRCDRAVEGVQVLTVCNHVHTAST